jgi:hypothetical protein
MEKNEERARKLKAEIAKILDINPELLIYEDRQDKDGQHSLELSTISPNRHKTKFLFHSATGSNADKALQSMYKYVTEHMKEQDTYQIRWHNPKNKEVEVSWFRASNIMEALGKFYKGKEVAEYKIYEVSLRPYA